MLIFGASGFAKQLLPTILQLGLQDEIVFYDNVSGDLNTFISRSFRVLRSESELIDYFKNVSNQFHLGIGGPERRKRITSQLIDLGGIPVSIFDPLARISELDVKIGNGVCVLQDAIVEPSAQIGEGVLVNLKAMITHDVKVGAFSEISPGAILLGGSQIGETCFIGAGAVILPKVTIGDRCIVGAGAIVNKSIDSDQRVAGVPAKTI